MRLTLLSFMLICLFSLNLFSQKKDDLSKSSDPFDLTSSREKIGKLGIPTVSHVANLEKKAKDLFSAGDWKNAFVALERYAKESNTLANLISSGIQPYYGASYNERNNFNDIHLLASYEKVSNDYKEKRNRAMVMQAECLLKQGQREEATAMLLKALDLISIDDKEWWTKARDELYALIEMK